MPRQLLALIVGMLTLVPYGVKADGPTPKKAAQPTSNRVYVKIIFPTDSVALEKDRPVVESWIAEQIEKTRRVQNHRRNRMGTSCRKGE